MSQAPPDMRNVVENNRSLLKKIELAIPGFRGYRKREDLRVADNLLRIFLADNLVHSRQGMGDLKKALAKKLELKLVERVGEVENQLHVVDKRLRHAEQGYSGVAPDYKVNDRELNALYNYDNQLMIGVDQISQTVRGIQAKTAAAPTEELMADVEAVAGMVKNFSVALDNRRNALIAAAGVR